MKKKAPANSDGTITNLDVAKALGMDKDYESGRLEGAEKEVYEELLREEEKRRESEAFNFKSQFNFPVDYYKAKMVLKMLDKKINLTKFVNKCDDLEDLTSFCDQHQIEILGYEVIKFTESEDLEEPPKMEYLGILQKPANAKNNQWALNSKEIISHMEMNYKVYPIMRISHETLVQTHSYDRSQLDLINEFDVSMKGEPLMEIMIGDLLKPDGYCLNCGHDAFSFDGKTQSCKACGSKTILQSNSSFPLSEDVRKEMRQLVVNLTQKEIE